MQELSIDEIDQVSGALTAGEAAALCLAVACISLTPITVGVALGAAAGLVYADVKARVR